MKILSIKNANHNRASELGINTYDFMTLKIASKLRRVELDVNFVEDSLQTIDIFGNLTQIVQNLNPNIIEELKLVTYG